MSRNKNAITLKTKQGETPLAGLTMEEKYWRIRYGSKFDQAAYDAVHALHLALTAETFPPLPLDKQIFETRRDVLWNYIAENYLKSWAKHDGSFFRALANAMEVHMQPNKPVWCVVGGEILFRAQRRLAMPTIAECVKRCADADAPTDRKTVVRIFEFYKVKPTYIKRGPKVGTRQKSVHRIRRHN